MENKVTIEAIENNILDEFYFTAGQGMAGALNLDIEVITTQNPEVLDLITFCVLLLKNGFTVVGQSACVDPNNFNKEIGQRIAREKAIEQIWPLMGYELKTKLNSK